MKSEYKFYASSDTSISSTVRPHYYWGCYPGN
jgi:hypothetical protein